MAARHKCHLSGLDRPLIGPICFTSLVPKGKRHSLASKDLRQNDVGKAGKRQASKIDFFHLGSNNRRDAAERLRFPCTVEFLQNPRHLAQWCTTYSEVIGFFMRSNYSECVM